MKEVEIYSCGCKYCEAKLSYCIGTFKRTLRCQCGSTCNHWGVAKEQEVHIHMHHKLLKYLKWLYIQQHDDKVGFNSALMLYREILKTSYTSAIKITGTIENITNYLCKQFKKDDIAILVEKNDTSFIKNALEELLSRKIKIFGFSIDADIGRFVEVLKPLIYPYVQLTQILRVLELKRPEVYAYITSDKERLWWLRQCINEMNNFIRFEPKEYMLAMDEVFGTKFTEGQEVK